MRRLRSAALALAALGPGLTATVLLAMPARADQLAVTIGDSAYMPTTVVVHAGDTVVWTNKDLGALGVAGRAHTVTADDGSFDSGDLATNATFSHVFPEQGKFTYHSTSANDSMKGTVRVLAAATSPSPGASPTPSQPVVIRTILPSPSPTAAPSPSPSPPASPSPSPSPKPSPSASPSPSPSPSPSSSPSPSETPIASTPSSGGSGTLLIVAVAGLVVAAAAGGGLLWLRRSPPGAPPAGGGPR